MDRRILQENRRHGSPEFPVGIYRMVREPGDPILDLHWHDETEFLAVESGRALFQIGSAAYEVEAGEALFIPGGELHGGYPLECSACTYSAVVFDLEWLAAGQDGLAERFFQPLRLGFLGLPGHWKSDTAWGREAYRRLREIASLETSDDPGKDLRIKGGLHMLFAEFASGGAVTIRESGSSAVDGAPERIKRALAYIEDHFARKLTVRELADAAGMSEGHFSRTFKSIVRQTPVEYVNRFRLRHAAERLRRSGVSVAEAAMESGFDHFSYFSKLFRSVYRCTPTEYRKQV